MTFLKAARLLRCSNRLAILLFIALIPVLMHYGCTLRNVSGRQVEMTTLASGAYSGMEERGQVVIDNHGDWEDLWAAAHSNIRPRPPVPQVDFSTHTIVAVFLGTRPTGGYGIEITRVYEKSGRLKAAVSKTSPLPGEMLTMAFTQPYHIVMIPVTGKEIDFIEN